MQLCLFLNFTVQILFKIGLSPYPHSRASEVCIFFTLFHSKITWNNSLMSNSHSFKKQYLTTSTKRLKHTNYQKLTDFSDGTKVINLLLNYLSREKGIKDYLGLLRIGTGVIKVITCQSVTTPMKGLQTYYQQLTANCLRATRIDFYK